MTTDPQESPAPTGKTPWIDRFVPARIRPYLKLARADRPIGTWLLLWPCWWGLVLACPITGRHWPDLKLMVLFALGALVMRGAGCTYNDIVDRDIDARVERTKSRPLPSGAVSVRAAWLFLVAQALVGLCVLLALNRTSILLGIVSLALVAIYPFMKRVTYWPQAFLGLTFNWGALMGYAAATGTLELPAFLLYGAGIAWTLGYDTIYAHQDKEDDALIGVKSTALRFGAHTKQWLCLFYAVMIVLLGFAIATSGLGHVAYWGLAAVAAHLFYQIVTLEIDDPARCLAVFQANRNTGLFVFMCLLAGALAAPVTDIQVPPGAAIQI